MGSLLGRFEDMSNFKMSLTEADPVVRNGYSTRSYDIGETWSRFPEVVLFAERNRVSVEAAIRTLVNSGLSHLHQPFSGAEIKDMSRRLREGDI